MAQALQLTDEGLNLQFKATFNNLICPFSVSVKPEFLELTKQKIKWTRFAQDYEPPDSTDGPSSHDATTIAAYWADKYSWSKIETEINSRFRQFTTIVNTDKAIDDPYLGPIPLHFVHHESPHPDAIPLLFVHGWPGSFLEAEKLLGPLTNPPNSSLTAFHVVAPSIPGYGFSPAPRRPGFGYRQAGAAFHALMKKLGYDKYVFQGGDAGDFINRYATADFPNSIVSGLSNFWVIPPSETDLERNVNGEASDDEQYVIEAYKSFINGRWSYGQIQQTQPLRLAAALTDSPVGLAMWIYEALRSCVPDPSFWTPELVITWTMMHWIPGPYGAFGLYKNGAENGAISTHAIATRLPYVHQPVAISEFPYDIWYRTPLDWACRAGNVKQYTVHKRGGHFAAFDAPDLLLQDIWTFSGNRELSGTKVFFE